MSIYRTQQQRTTDPIVVNLPIAFDHTPAVLVTPFWQGQGESVGSIETILTTNLTDECKITSGNKDPNYLVNILALYRVYFQSPFTLPPVVFLSSWWNGTQSTLSSIETVTDVTNEYFDAISDNAASNYFVNWMAFGNT